MIVISSKTEDNTSVAYNGLEYFLKEHLYFLATAFSQHIFNFLQCRSFYGAIKNLVKQQEHKKSEMILYKYFNPFC